MTLRELPKDVLDRGAVVYVRQSTGLQVQENLESQRRQYDLLDLARRYGFRDVAVIDADLGRSASGTMDRPGFVTVRPALRIPHNFPCRTGETMIDMRDVRGHRRGVSRRSARRPEAKREARADRSTAGARPYSEFPRRDGIRGPARGALSVPQQRRGELQTDPGSTRTQNGGAVHRARRSFGAA